MNHLGPQRHSQFRSNRMIVLLTGLLLTVAPISLRAEDHFLTIGGGYSPTGNQISLEKNVFFFQEVLNDLYAEEPSHQILFSDGKDPGRDLQYAADESALPRANELLAKIHRQTKHLTYKYRDHQIDSIFGASNRDNLENWFEKVGAGLSKGDRLFIYATAHGGKSGDKEDPSNTKLYLWNRQSITMQEFSRLLDKVDSEVPVVLVMVQCYSGGFADLVFENGNAEDGFNDSPVCGFYATVQDRVAAGCTADIKEEDYHEYSTYFWAAIRGMTRTGSPVQRPDFDENGLISFEEAHAYALIESSTIDISVKTSDAFLRHFSSFDDAEQRGLTSPDSPLSGLLESASPADRAVIEKLSEQLGLLHERLYSAADSLGDRLMNEKRQKSRSKRSISRDYNRACDAIKRDLLLKWPELDNQWNPESARLLTESADELVGFIESHREYRNMLEYGDQLSDISKQEQDLDRRWVKCQRLRRTLENIALAANLSQVAEPEVVERFEALLQSERQSLGDIGQSSVSY